MITNKRGPRIAAAALALATAGTGLGLVAAGGAAAADPQHVQRFTSRTVHGYQLDGQGHYVDFARDLRHGRLIGSDASTGRYHAATGVVTGYVTFFRAGGAVEARFRFPTRGHNLTIRGVIVGGQGSFADARGTVIGTVVNDDVTRTVLRYHT